VKRITLRYVLILAIISVAGIISIQIYWFSRAFDIRDMQFNQSVNIALRNVADQLRVYNNSPIPQINPVEQLSSNYFVVMVNDQIDVNLLETLIVNEFKRRNLKVDFEYGVYDCMNEKMVFGNYINLASENGQNMRSKTVLPAWEDNDYYFGVIFPNKENALLSQMGIWIFLSAVLLIVVSFFAYALYIIFRQRQFSETQKQFINNMTHEFRTPISTIQLSSGVLQDPGIIKDRVRLVNYAQIIQEESNRLYRQVETILQAALIDDKKLTLQKATIDVHEIIEDVIKSYTLILADGKMDTSLEATRHTVFGDKIHFTNLIKNLVDNAIKYSTEPPQLTLSTTNEKKEIYIEIKDRGIGIPKQYQKKVFKKFYRVPTGNVHNVKGFGLGLNYVKNITKMHKGRLNLESKPGEGSIFTLRFPVVYESG